MANAKTEHSKQLRAGTAAAYNKAKLASGEYKQMRLQGKAAQIDLINTAVTQAGGNKYDMSSLAALLRLELHPHLEVLQRSQPARKTPRTAQQKSVPRRA